MSTIIGFNSDNEYGGRYAGKVKTLPPYNPDYNPTHPINDIKNRSKNETNITQTTEAQTDTVNFDMNPTYKTFATKDIGVSPIATITPQFKEFDDKSLKGNTLVQFPKIFSEFLYSFAIIPWCFFIK